jgi:small subunit ribosomal protein S8
MTDSTADFLTRIRNGVMADQDEVLIPSSRFNRELARVLKQEGYIEDFAVEMMRPVRRKRATKRRSDAETIKVRLKYTQDRQPVISGLKRISTPGRRRYVTADELPRVLGGMGTAIITTSRGVMTANEAKRERVGGEVVAFVW